MNSIKMDMCKHAKKILKTPYPLKNTPELLKLSIGEDRLGEVSISEYLKDRLTDTPLDLASSKV